MLSQVFSNRILLPRGLNEIELVLGGLRKVVTSVSEKSGEMRCREQGASLFSVPPHFIRSIQETLLQTSISSFRRDFVIWEKSDDLNVRYLLRQLVCRFFS